MWHSWQLLLSVVRMHLDSCPNYRQSKHRKWKHNCIDIEHNLLWYLGLIALNSMSIALNSMSNALKIA